MRTAADLLTTDARTFRPNGYTFYGVGGGGVERNGLNPRDRIYRKLAQRTARDAGYEISRGTALRDALRKPLVLDFLAKNADSEGSLPAKAADALYNFVSDKSIRLRRVSPIHQGLRDLYYPAAAGGGAYAAYKMLTDDADAAPRMTPEEIAALKRAIKGQTVNDNRVDDLQSLRASLQGVRPQTPPPAPKPSLGVIPGGLAALGPGVADAAQKFNQGLDTSLDVAGFFDPSMGYATETARALKDLPGKAGGLGTVALAPVVGATNMLSSIGQLPELAGAGLDAIKRAIKAQQEDARRMKAFDAPRSPPRSMQGMETQPTGKGTDIKTYTPQKSNSIGNELLSLVGLGQAEALMMGPKSKTWNAQNAEKAKQLEASGATPWQIWSQTGTFRDKGGMWRQEIDDEQAKMTGAKSGSVFDVMQHDKLRTAYPNLESVQAERLYSSSNPKVSPFSVGASFSGRGKPPRIELYENPVVDFAKFGSALAGDIGGVSPRSAMLHEVQHQIDRYEGAKSGGNPQSAGGYFKYQNLAGEQLAQTVQARRDYTPHARAALYPFGLSGEIEARLNKKKPPVSNGRGF